MPVMRHGELPPDINDLSHGIVGCAMEVHRVLGPGLLESLYEEALMFELRARGLMVARQVAVEVPYKSIILSGQRLDLVVGGVIVVELKALAKVLDVHRAQLLSYLRAVDLPLGLLINFNVGLIKDDLHRILDERWTGHRLGTSRAS